LTTVTMLATSARGRETTLEVTSTVIGYP
jgi:hypothetical protein